MNIRFSKYMVLLLALLLQGGCHRNTVSTTAAATGPTIAGDNCTALVFPESVSIERSPRWIKTAGLPRYCRIRGTVADRVRFELRLPEAWNGRFMMAGCGGFCGALLPDKPGHSNSINQALKRGYAAISHDGGHRAKSWETEWAYQDREALEVWAHRVLPLVTEAGLAITESMYGRPPHHKYFSGCSNGGRLGLMAAQRYPGLFDGIAAGGSIFDLSGTAGLWGNWMTAHTTRNGENLFSVEKLPLVKGFVMKQCDGIDGQTDHIITDPRACQVDFSKLQCSADTDHDACLTAGEVTAMKKLYRGVEDSQGNVIYPALAYGSEHYNDIWLFGSPDKPAWGQRASEGYRQLLSMDLLNRRTPAPIATDEMQHWIDKSSVPTSTDAVNSDLSGLRRAGTKLLIYQGWSDPLIIPEPIIDYYQRAGGFEKLQTHARLFMVPGMGHCWERPAQAPDSFDPLEVVERWVENDQAPEAIIAEQTNKANEIVRTRPVCAYPAVAQLIRGENPDKHQNYRCQ